MRKTVLAVSAILLAASLGICAAGENKGKLVFGFSWAHKNDTLFYAMDDTLAAATAAEAKKRGYEGVEWVHVVSGYDTQKQASDIEDLITRGVDLIVCYPYDKDAILTSIQSVRDEGIPIITFDRDGSKDGVQADAWIGLDSTLQAYDAGVALFKAMREANVKPAGVLEIVGDLADQNALNRINGFKRAADEYGVDIVQQIPSEWSSDKALSGFSAAFQAHPECNVVLCASDIIGPSVLQSVLEKAGKWKPQGDPNHVWIASQDVFPTAIEPLRKGYIDFDTAYDVLRMAEEFAPVALDFIEGKGLGEGRKVMVQGRVVTPQNIDTIEGLWARDY